jgi:hypothetical protein
VEWENIKQTRSKEAENDLEMVENTETNPFLPVSAMKIERRREPSKERRRESSKESFRQES